MLGRPPFLCWKICWMFVSPIIICVSTHVYVKLYVNTGECKVIAWFFFSYSNNTVIDLCQIIPLLTYCYIPVTNNTAIELLLFPCVQIILLFAWIDYSPIQYGSYSYPEWAEALGWLMSFFSIIFIPIVMLYKINKEDEGKNAWEVGMDVLSVYFVL